MSSTLQTISSSLPPVLSAVPTALRLSEANHQGNHRSLRILYVEDNEDCRRMVSRVLVRDGHEVTGVGHGGEACELLSKESVGFDLIITDHEMPVMNGLVFVSWLRTFGHCGSVLSFSSSISDDLRGRYLAVGVHHFLPKPAPLSEIRAAVVRATTAHLIAV